MNRIQAITEAKKELTAKRIFETKLKGLRLCISHHDLDYGIQLLVDNGVIEIEKGYTFIAKYPMIIIRPGSGIGVMDHITVGNRYTLAE